MIVDITLWIFSGASLHKYWLVLKPESKKKRESENGKKVKIYYSNIMTFIYGYLIDIKMDNVSTNAEYIYP